MEILNLKVIDKNRLIKNLNFKAKNGRNSSAKVINLVALGKVARSNPTLSNYIERVVSGRINIAPGGVKVQYLINKVNINLCNGL